MEYREIGQSGIIISILGLGTYDIFKTKLKDIDHAKRLISVAFEYGINHFDTADIYDNGDSEIILGEILKQIPRAKTIVSSKVGLSVKDGGLSEKNIKISIDKSLRRLQLDYIDVYYCHRFDFKTPIEETIRAMNGLIASGKIRCWGTSEYTYSQLTKIHTFCKKNNLASPIVEQTQYSLAFKQKFEKDTMKSIKKFKIGAIAWSPLASGLLTGKYNNGIPKDSRFSRKSKKWLKEIYYKEETLNSARLLDEISNEMGVTSAQVALAWLADKQAVSGIMTGVSNIEQLQSNIQFLNIKINDEIKNKLEQLYNECQYSYQN